MQIILLENIRNLGRIGDTVNVKPGFGRNFLIPKGKALPGTSKNLEEVEKRRAEFEEAEAAHLKTAQARAIKLSGLTITLAAEADHAGKLYGSISPKAIADAATAMGHEVDKSEISMPKGLIRQIGEYTLNIQLHSDVVSSITLQVNAVAEKS